MIRNLLCLLSFVVLVHAVSRLPRVGAADARPNVIIIYTDDQGSLDLNCYGSRDLHTPQLDELASQGVRFTQMYSPSAICSSSRAGLMTGRFPARAGVPSNVSSGKGHPGMPSSEMTIAELMKSAGYATGHVGKWHLGYTPETMPNGQGFDSSFGHMGGCIDNYSHFFYWNGPNRHDLWRDGKEIFRDGQFFLDLMVEEGQQFIKANRDGPFFMYWAINAPHYPMQGTSKWREHYKDLPSPRRQYAEFVSTVDEKIGDLIGTLDQLGLRENTLIVVQSDHGHSTEERAFWGGGNAGPYRGAKASLFEGGLRVPSVVSMPGTIPQNETRDQLATGCDWFPTIAELCGIELPEHHLDGKSLAAVLKNQDAESPHDHFYWQLGGGKNAQWAVRQGDWKLLGNARDTTDRQRRVNVDKLFLANLKQDIGETKNLAADHPEIVQTLQALQQKHYESIAKAASR
ncbi:sulfatase-like hydrolase/transferase [Roseimaritima ulvae]|uniref:Arylsulfatase n=1 Tax=Roseimaritima ulvae TaxID=980254 RepID=A0A5B9QTG3_9BACT|nr:sulfatase-like hydrolase/transferase [Roseimaritima ulvae]QEG40695.1 Arylsulfatase precursor [Roseimaritima ulvae]